MRRNTQQRDTIRRVIEETGRPLSAGEILSAAGRTAEGLGIATVYRNVKSMVAEGKLTVVNLPGEPARYEVAGKGHHHHFICEGCDRVFEVAVCAPGLKKMTPRGFRLERHEVILYGRCADCAK